MNPSRWYPILPKLFSSFRRSQQKTLILVVTALLEVVQATSIAIAGQLAVWTGVKPWSALNRLYRLLRNPRIADHDLCRQVLQLFLDAGERLVIAIDWTEWHSNLRMLLASVVVDRRAIPVYAAAVHKQDMPRSQNTRENTFLRVVVEQLRAWNRTGVFLADRGFRRVSLIALLQQLEQHFVIRLIDDLTVHVGGRARPLSNWHLHRGQVVDFGRIALRQDRKTFARVIGVRAPDQTAIWWLATNLDDPVATIVGLYDRRMTIEEQIRDTKGCRFGLKLEWTQFRNPASLGRFMLLLGMALAIWTAVGAAAVQRDPALCMPSKTKGRRLSLPRVGARWLGWYRSRAYIGIEFVRSYLPPPHVRLFAWLVSEPQRRRA